MIHLDTSFVVDLIRESRRGEPGRATRELEARSEEQLGMSVHALCELRAGAELARDRAAEHRRVDVVCGRVTVVLPDERLPPIYGRLLADLKRRGETVATLDLLIAAAAIADDVDLVTSDRRHFSRISGLRLITY